MTKQFIKRRIALMVAFIMTFSLITPITPSFAETTGLQNYLTATTPGGVEIPNVPTPEEDDNTTPSSITLRDLRFQSNESSKFQKIPVVVSFDVATEREWSAAKELRYQLILSDGEEQVALTEIRENHKKFESVYDKSYLLGYLPTEIKSGIYSITLEGYRGTDLVINQTTEDFSINADKAVMSSMNTYLSGNGELNVSISSLQMDLEELNDDKVGVIIKDSKKEVIAKGDAYIGHRGGWGQIWPFDNYIEAYDVEATLELLTHNLTPGKNTVILVVGDKEIEIGETSNTIGEISFWIDPQRHIFKDQNEFTATIRGNNIPSKDYLKISVIEKTDAGEVIVAKAYETAYDQAHVDITNEYMTFIAKFKVEDGKELEENKSYYFRVEAEDGKEISYHQQSNFQLAKGPQIISRDISQHKESIISFKTVNCLEETEYEAVVTSTDYTTQSSIEYAGTARAFLDGDTLSFTFLSADKSAYKFDNNRHYSIRVTDKQKSFYQYENFYINIDQNEPYISYVNPKVLSLGIEEYEARMDVWMEYLSKEAIQSISLVQVNNENNIVAKLELEDQRFKVQYHGNSSNATINGYFKLTGEVDDANRYHYVIELTDGRKIKSRDYNPNNISFTNEISVRDISIDKSVNRWKYETQINDFYLPISAQELSFHLYDIMNIVDIEKLDISIQDSAKNKVALLDRESFYSQELKNKRIDYVRGTVLIGDNKLQDGEVYTLVVSYDGIACQTRNLIFTDKVIIQSINITDNNIISKEQSQFDLDLYNTFNLDPANAKILLVKEDLYNEEFNLAKAIKTDATFTQDERYPNNYHAIVSGINSIDVGRYRILLTQGNDLAYSDSYYITVTDKSMVFSGTKYSYHNSVLTEYEISATNLDRNAKYDVYIYANEYYEHYMENDGYESTHLDPHQLIRKLETVTINSKGNIIFTPEDLKDLRQGQYKLFFEMNKKIIGQGQLNINELETPMKVPSFFINGDKFVTDQREVELQITLAGYNQIRISESLEELQGQAYESVTEEELAKGLALKKYTLSEGNGDKPIYLQLKSKDGNESEVLKNKIRLEPDFIEPPFEVSHNGGDKVQENQTITIFAKGKQNVSGYVAILGADNKEIRTLSLTNLGINADRNYDYQRSITLSGDLANVKAIKVYFANVSGKNSEAVTIPITMERLFNIKGQLTVDEINGQATPIRYTTVMLEKKNNENNYVNLLTMTTDYQGYFNFNSLQDGDYRLLAYYNGKQVSKEVTIKGSDITDLKLNIENEFNKKGSLKVIVQDTDKTPIKNATVSIGSWQTRHYVNKVTNDSGEIEFTEIPTKAEGVAYSVSLYHDGVSRWIDQVVTEGAIQVTLELPKVVSIKGTVTDKDGKGVENVNVNSQSPNWRYGWAITDKNGHYEIKILDPIDQDTYKVQVSQNSGSTRVALGKHEYVTPGAIKVDFKLVDGVKVYGEIKKSNGEPVKDVNLYASSATQWNNTLSNDDGNFDFGYVFGVGTHSISVWTDGQYLTQEVTISEEDLTSNEDTAKKIAFTLIDKTSNPFKGEGNNVKSNVSATQKGKNVTVKVNITNNSTIELKDLLIKAELPLNVELATITAKDFTNEIEKRISSLKSKESASFTFIIKTNDKFDATNMIIPVKVVVGEMQYNVGYTDVEIVAINLQGPAMSVDGDFSVYGETIEGGKVTIIDKNTGRALASTKPNGKWYTANINLAEGEYELIAQVEKENNTAISDILTVKVSKTDGIQIQEIEVNSAGGQKIGINKDTGIAAFSVWVDMALRGKDILAKVKLSSGANVVIEEAQYEFAGKKYRATLTDGYYSANLTGWSGTGNKKVILKVKVKGQEEWFEFVVADITILIDPSGYVEDEHSKERITGATAICEKLEEGEWKFWDASKYGQINPQMTDENGEYGWMVPDGTYRVKITKDGYEDYITTADEKFADKDGNSSIIIPPARDDVFISITNTMQPIVEKITITTDSGIILLLNKAVDKATVNNKTILVKDKDGQEVEGTVTLSLNNKEIIFVPTNNFASEEMYTVDIAGVMDFKGKVTEAKELKYSNEIKAPKIENVDTTVKLESLTLSMSTEMKKGDTQTIAVTYNPSNTTQKGVQWSSSNTNVATIVDGKITALGGGTTTITVTSTVNSAISAKAELTVTEESNNSGGGGTGGGASEKPTEIVVESLKLSELKGMKKGDTQTITVTYNPSNTTQKGVQWSSSNTNVATIVDGKITALGGGTTTITVTSTVNSAISAKAELTVTEEANNSGGSGSGSSGGGGGSSAKPADPKENTVTEKGAVTIGTNSITVESKDGIVTATISKEGALKAIELAVKEAKSGMTPQIVVPLSSVTDANMSVEMPAQIIQKALESKVNIVISSKEMQYTIPFGALEKIELKADETIVFSSKELKDHAIKGTNNNDKVLKVIDFNLILKSKTESKNIAQFSKPIEIRISVKGLGDASKLGIYYVNETDATLELISNKVEDDFIIMSTDHYSKYAIIESTPVAAIEFSDIANHWAKGSIESIAAKGIVGGYPDGTFKPNNNITRAEFVAMMNTLLGFKEVVYTGQFKDVKAGSWFANSVATAAANGLVGGYPDGKFNPNGKITRAEMMSIISVTIKDTTVNADEIDTILASFADKDSVAPWAKESVAKAIKAGLIGGIDSKIQSNAETTRAQAVTVIDRILKK